MKNALGCYVTYRDTIEKSGVIEKIGDKVYFEIFGENYSEALSSLTEGLTEGS